MDFTTHAAANGLDLLLWLGFLYLAPRLLRLKPRARVPQTRPQLRRLPPLTTNKAALKTA